MLLYWALNTSDTIRVQGQCAAVSYLGLSGWYNTTVPSESKKEIYFFSETSRERFIVRNPYEEDFDYQVRTKFGTLTLLLSI